MSVTSLVVEDCLGACAAYAVIDRTKVATAITVLMILFLKKLPSIIEHEVLAAAVLSW
jgi:hypothetical protein